MGGVSRGIDRIEVVLDDPILVANARQVAPATLMARLGLEALVNAMVRLVGRVGEASPGRKVCHDRLDPTRAKRARVVDVATR